MDIIQDRSYRTLTRLVNGLGYDIPAYVRQYTPADEKIASQMPDTAFASPARREYPVDSAGATWLSALYAAKDLQAGSQIAKDAMPGIKVAAEIWEIQDDVDKALEAVGAALQKTASDSDADYGWVDRDKDGNVVSRRYGIFDSAGVMKAAEYFGANRDHYHYRTREKIARFILHKAAQYDVPEERLGTEIQKEAGYGIPVKETVMHELNERARLAKHAECGILLANVNNLLAAAGPEELSGAMDKVAEIVNEFDIAEDLTRYYGKRLTRPSDFMCAMPLKLAESLSEKAVTLDGRLFDYVKLAEHVPAQEFYRVLGPDFVNSTLVEGTFDEDNPETAVKISAEKLRTALSGLDRSQARELNRHIVTLCVA